MKKITCKKFTNELFILFYLLFFFGCKTTRISIPGENEKINRNIASEYYNIAEGYVGLKNYTKAAEYYRLAIRDKDVKFAAYYKLGRCYALSKKWDEAEKVFKLLLQRDRDNLELQRSYAYVKTMKGDTDESLEIYRLLKESNPENQEVFEDYISLKIALSDTGSNSLTEESLEELKNEVKNFGDTFSDSAKLKEFNSKIDEFTEKLELLKPTAEAMNVSKAEETVPATTE